MADTPKYRMEMIPDKTMPHANPRTFRVVDERGNVMARECTGQRDTAEAWCARQIGYYKLDAAQVEEQIRRAFRAAEPVIGQPVTIGTSRKEMKSSLNRFSVAHPIEPAVKRAFRLEATARIAGGFIAINIFDDKDVRRANCNTTSREYADNWCSQFSTEFPFDTAAANREIESAFAQLGPSEPIDAEFQSRSAVESRRYEARRERFALAVFRELIRKHAQGLPGLSQMEAMADEAVLAADVLEERLNPTKPILPPYEA